MNEATNLVTNLSARASMTVTAGAVRRHRRSYEIATTAVALFASVVSGAIAANPVSAQGPGKVSDDVGVAALHADPVVLPSVDGPLPPKGSPAHGTGSDAEVQEPAGATGSFDARGESPTTDEFDQLARAAAATGTARVIVGFKMSFVPEGHLPAQAVEAQRATIARQTAALNRELRGSGHAVVREYEMVPYVALEVPLPAVEALRRSPRVASVQIDEPVPPALAESGPLVEADQMWAAGYTGSDFAVAILDTGVQRTHPFFGGRVVEEACYSTNSAQHGVSSLCPGGVTTATGLGTGEDCVGASGCGHGTHVAGIAAGAGSAFSGVAKGADIISIQVFSRVNSPSTCSEFGRSSPCVLTYPSDQQKALEHVARLAGSRNVAAANMSLGGGRWHSACDGHILKPIIDTLVSLNVATIVATGNDGWTDKINAPACISSAIAVGNTTKADAVSATSNGHPTMVDLLAPGTSIYSAIPGGRYDHKNGTSMAAPHVAGAWAVLRQARPNASVAEILQLLKSTGVSVTDTRSGAGYSHPRIRIARAGLNRSTFATATKILDELPFVASRSTVGAVLEPGEPSSCPSADQGGTPGSIGSSVWYRYTPEVDRRLVVDTVGSTYDTVLAVYTGSTVNALSPVPGACNDDASGAGRQSRIVFAVKAGVTYHFQVAGWRTSTGQLILNVAEVNASLFEEFFSVPPVGWTRTNLSEPLGARQWGEGNTSTFASFSGPSWAYASVGHSSTTGDTGTISNWLISPYVSLGGHGVVTFRTRTVAGSTYPDRLEVRASTNSSCRVAGNASSVGDFTTLLTTVNPSLTVGGYPENWTRFEVPVSAGAVGSTGCLAFRYSVSNGGPNGRNSNYIGLDDVTYEAVQLRAPGAPTAVTARAGNGSATVSWAAPAASGGAPITSYRVTSSPDGRTCSTTGALTCTVTGLRNGVSYTFRVVASNSVGGSSPSAPSNGVTPAAPVVLSLTPPITAPAGSQFAPLPEPARLFESRAGLKTVDGKQLGAGRRGGGSVTVVEVAGRGGVPKGAGSAVLNVTAVNPVSRGFVTVYPCGPSRPEASSLNFVPGAAVANGVIAKLSSAGTVCVFTNQEIDLVVDVTGSFPSSSDFGPLPEPARLFESRAGLKTVDGKQVGAGRRGGGSVTVVEVAGRGGVPKGAGSAVLNVTAVNPVSRGFVTVYPCGPSRPEASSLNFVPGAAVANGVIAKLSAAGTVCVFTNQEIDLVVDVTGSFPQTPR